MKPWRTDLTEDEATALAALEYGWRPRQLHGRWVVWCDIAGHVVEFDQDTIDYVFKTEGMR